MLAIVKSKATILIQIQKQRFSRCRFCERPVYFRQVELATGNVLRTIAFNWFDNTRHRCYLEPILYENNHESSQQLEVTRTESIG